MSIILDKLVSEFIHKAMFICKTHNNTLQIRNHHFIRKLTDLFKIIETKYELFNTILCEQMPSEGNGKCRVMAWVIRINMIDLCHL